MTKGALFRLASSSKSAHLIPAAECLDLAVNGRSTKSFIDEWSGDCAASREGCAVSDVAKGRRTKMRRVIIMARV
jgi:hypothetical protein